MSILKALERHIPAAALLIRDSELVRREDFSERLWHSIEPEAFEVLVCLGVSGDFYSLARSWLDENGRRRLIFVEENGSHLAHLLENEDAILLLNDVRVKLYFLESPLQIEPLSKKIAWRTVFLETGILILRESGSFLSLRSELEKCRTAAHLLLSDGADWGISLLENFAANRKKPSRSGFGLSGKFQGVAAVVVGAGPSLERNGHLLKYFEDKALILAGGSALNVLDLEPHFAASIDKDAPYRRFKTHPFFETPFCYQSRMNRDNFSQVHGPSLLFPDGNAPWINWINGQEEEFDAGWTVGNFLTSFAYFLGCDPIIFVGMDLCYRDEKKYAHLEGGADAHLIQIEREGKTVWTQRDWLMAAQWTEQFALRHPERRWLNATEGSICNIPFVPLSDLLNRLERKYPLREKVHEEIQSIPLFEPKDRWASWESSLLRSKLMCDAISDFDREELEQEPAYQFLLKPLWDIWKPVFEREIELDSQALSFQEKMDLNEILFFTQVLEEHVERIIS